MINIQRSMDALGFSKFETQQFCDKQNALMLKRLSRHAPDQYQFYCDLLDDDPHSQRDGDWLACRSARAALIIGGSKLLCGRTDLHFITYSHPRWRLPCGKLNNIDIDLVSQFVYRRFRPFGPDFLAAGAFEARLAVELDKTRWWEGHVHLVTAGASESEIKAALRDVRGHRRPHEKPLKVEEIGYLPTRLGYSTKRVLKQHIAYLDENGRQQRRKLPPTVRDQVEYDEWLLSLEAGGRQILHGLRMHGDHMHRLRRDE